MKPTRNQESTSAIHPLLFFLFTFFNSFISYSATNAEEDKTTYAVADSLFNASRVLDIEIEIDPKDWDELREASRDLFSSLTADAPSESPFKYVKGDITIDGKRIQNVGIRKKGFLGSLDENRPSLKIRFDKYQDQRPFGPLTRLTLNNNKQDDSKLSQYLSYKLFAESGVPAPRCNFARVKVNGESLGIYSNVESVKPAMLQRVFGDGTGLLAEGTLADVLPSAKQRFEYKSTPKINTGIDKLTKILESPDLDVAELEKILNINSFIRFWATESLIGFWDGYTHNQNNFFIYENPEDSRLCFMPWGTDSAFTAYVPRIIEPIKNLSVHTNSAVANRLYHHPQMRERYLKTLRTLLATQWNEEELLNEIDRVEAMLSDQVLSVRRLNGGTDRVRGFIKTRRGAIEKKLAQWPIKIATGPRVPGLVTQYGEVSGNFATTWTKEAPSAPESTGVTDIKARLNDEDLAFSAIGVTTKLDRNYDDKKRDGILTPTIIFTGVRRSDNKTYTFVAKVKPQDFHSSTKEVPVTGIFIEGSMIAFFTMLAFNPAAIKLVSGSVQLDEASMDDGAKIAGKTKLKIVGFSQKRTEKRTWVRE